MAKSKLDSILNQEIRFVKDTHRNNIGRGDIGPTFFLQRGIVVKVNQSVNDSDAYAALVPPYSLQVKIIGEDLSTPRPEFERDLRWYPPLLPIHNLAIPEIGEEVIIMRESSETNTKGFWMGRVNEFNKLNFGGAKAWNDAPVNMKFEGTEFDINGMHDAVFIKPQDDLDQSILPVRAGDVIQQGRSGSYIRHSFHPLFKGGVLESGIRGPEPTRIAADDPTVGITRTKTLHVSRVVLDDLMGDYRFIPNPLTKYALSGETFNVESLNNIGRDRETKNIIMNIADEHYALSIDEYGNNVDNYIYSHVLGEKNIELVNNLFGTVKILVDQLNVLYKLFLEHTHLQQPYEFNEVYYVPTEAGIQNVNVRFEIPQVKTEKLPQGLDTEILKLELRNINPKLESTLEKIEDILSKTQYLQ